MFAVCGGGVGVGSLSGFSGVEGLAVAGTLALVALLLPFREAFLVCLAGLSEYRKNLKK